MTRKELIDLLRGMGGISDMEEIYVRMPDHNMVRVVGVGIEPEETVWFELGKAE
jgi:hypothetical protein